MISAVKSLSHQTKSGSRGALICFVLTILLAGCSDSSVTLSLSGPTMGTTYNITIVDEEMELEPADIAHEVANMLAEVNQVASTYIDDSELMRFNRADIGVAVSLSQPLFDMFRLSAEIHSLSQGAFDVTVGPIVNLWGFGRDIRSQAPEEEAIQQALAKVGFEHIVLNEETKTATKQQPLEVDLSAIAKGYAVDVLADYMDSLHINNYLVEIGGEIRVKGQNPDGKDWRIGIESPEPQVREPVVTVSISNAALATSGDYRNFIVDGGVRYSHTLDPRTGRPITHNIASLTVIDPKSARADGLATGLNVLGYELALEICEQQHLACFFILHSGKSFEQAYSSEFAQYVGKF